MRLNAWWWGPNFGDDLTEWLLPQIADVQLEHSELWEAEFFGIGSILHRIPPTSRAFIWTTGRMWPGDPALQCLHDIVLPNARILALRGSLTANHLRVGKDVPLGDGGLLVSDVAQARPSRKMGLVPHHNDPDLQEMFPDAHMIDVMAPVPEVVEEIASCEKIVSSSLHGLVVADSLGIPNYWVRRDTDKSHGLKYQDYASAFGEVLIPHTWRLADQARLYEVKERLREALHGVT